MKLGVIGSGNIGKSIGSWCSKLGYDVIFSARDMNHAKEAAAQAGNNSRAASVSEVAETADIILLAVPYNSVMEVLDEIRKSVKGKILIDATNPLSPDYSSLSLGFNTSAAEEIQKSVPEAKVVKAFNSIFASIYASQASELGGRKIAAFYASDDERAKSLLSELLKKMGFDPVDSGPLRNARLLEPLALLNINLGYGMGHGTNIGFGFLH
jgi:NADPH-dependent F420 reductase